MRISIIALLVALMCGPSASAQTFSDEAWAGTEDIYQAILRHPFLKQMQTGELDQEVFKDYLVHGACSIVQTDVARIGGITPWMKVAHMAEGGQNGVVIPQITVDCFGS